MADMSATRILVVEDSEAIRLPVLTALTGQGFEARGLPDGQGLESAVAAFGPDLVVLDVMLPGRDGFELLDVVRRASTAAGVMLTARDTTADRVRGPTAGADGYLVKPFSLSELVARLPSVLRRTRPGGGTVSVGDLEISADAVWVQRGGRPVELTDTERRVLAYLAGHRGRLVSKTQILTA